MSAGWGAGRPRCSQSRGLRARGAEPGTVRAGAVALRPQSRRPAGLVGTRTGGRVPRVSGLRGLQRERGMRLGQREGCPGFSLSRSRVSASVPHPPPSPGPEDAPSEGKSGSRGVCVGGGRSRPGDTERRRHPCIEERAAVLPALQTTLLFSLGF